MIGPRVTKKLNRHGREFYRDEPSYCPNHIERSKCFCFRASSMTNTALQMILFPPDTEWVPPSELPDLSAAKEIAIDLETRDPQLKTHGPGWARPDSGEVVGVVRLPARQTSWRR